MNKIVTLKAQIVLCLIKIEWDSQMEVETQFTHYFYEDQNTAVQASSNVSLWNVWWCTRGSKLEFQFDFLKLFFIYIAIFIMFSQTLKGYFFLFQIY